LYLAFARTDPGAYARSRLYQHLLFNFREPERLFFIRMAFIRGFCGAATLKEASPNRTGDRLDPDG
jgi:hypothetical protein